MKSFCPHKVATESYWPTYDEIRDFNSKWRESGFSNDLRMSGVFTGSKLTYMAFPICIAKKLSTELGRPCRVIDLGSGAGKAGFYFNKADCEVIGIEKNGCRHELSQLHLELLKQAGILENKILLKFLHADIFPPGFKAKRCFVGNSDIFAAQLAPTSVGSSRHIPNELYKWADLFYHFQVETADNLLRLFVEQAKPGALLYITQHGHPHEYSRVPRGVRYLNQEDSFLSIGHLYQKIS